MTDVLRLRSPCMARATCRPGTGTRSVHPVCKASAKPPLSQADYFYVVQSGSFQVSKTDNAASAEKLLGASAVQRPLSVTSARSQGGFRSSGHD